MPKSNDATERLRLKRRFARDNADIRSAVARAEFPHRINRNEYDLFHAFHISTPEIIEMIITCTPSQAVELMERADHGLSSGYAKRSYILEFFWCRAITSGTIREGINMKILSRISCYQEEIGISLFYLMTDMLFWFSGDLGRYRKIYLPKKFTAVFTDVLTIRYVGLDYEMIHRDLSRIPFEKTYLDILASRDDSFTDVFIGTLETFIEALSRVPVLGSTLAAVAKFEAAYWAVLVHSKIGVYREEVIVDFKEHLSFLFSDALCHLPGSKVSESKFLDLCGNSPVVELDKDALRARIEDGQKLLSELSPEFTDNQAA